MSDDVKTTSRGEAKISSSFSPSLQEYQTMLIKVVVEEEMDILNVVFFHQPAGSSPETDSNTRL